MVPTVVLLLPRLGLNVVDQVKGELVASGEVGFLELAGGVEAAVLRNVEDSGTCWIKSAAGVILHSYVEDHLGNELMGGEPRGGGA
ncbi:hypothetical protein ACFX1Z_019102 [Malus domestica]